MLAECCRTPPRGTPQTPTLTSTDIRAAVRRRAASRGDEDPTTRRPTRPCKPITPPARRAVLVAPPPAPPGTGKHPRTAGTSRKTATKGPTGPRTPLSLRLERVQNQRKTAVTRRPNPTARSIQGRRLSTPTDTPTNYPRATITASHGPQHQATIPQPTSSQSTSHQPPGTTTTPRKQACETATTISKSNRISIPTTKVAVPGATLEVPTRVIQSARRYRARTSNGHWALRWDRTGRLTLARFHRKENHP